MNIQIIVDLLNNELKLEPIALQNILDYRTSCIGKTQEDLDQSKMGLCNEGEGNYYLSSLGLINTILGEIYGKRIMAVYSNEGILEKLEVYNG